jgi:hypothetical protein
VKPNYEQAISIRLIKKVTIPLIERSGLQGKREENENPQIATMCQAT